MAHSRDVPRRSADRVPRHDQPHDVPAGARPESPVRPDLPLPVRVWISDGQGRDYEASGQAIAWTSRAVYVRFLDQLGREGFCWVWASAVQRQKS